MKITVRQHERRLPAKPSDPLIEAYSAFVGRELVSELEEKLPDLARAYLERLREIY